MPWVNTVPIRCVKDYFEEKKQSIHNHFAREIPNFYDIKLFIDRSRRPWFVIIVSKDFPYEVGFDTAINQYCGKIEHVLETHDQQNLAASDVTLLHMAYYIFLKKDRYAPNGYAKLYVPEDFSAPGNEYGA
ncbi:hypothetical protein F4819DRAFT_489588 [Hypoxylon fuscum]|nr:hypothetical protein F4819DRAFT_489588 [Hypoxylon fuscum]